MLCRVMQVSTSAFYAWCQRGGEVIDSEIWRLCRRMKAPFEESRSSLDSRQLMKQLRKEGFEIGRYRTRTLMRKLGLEVKRKKRFVLTTYSKHSQPVADNVCWIGISRQPGRTGSGQRTLPTSGHYEAGYTWQWCWICIHAGLSAGIWMKRWKRHWYSAP